MTGKTAYDAIVIGAGHNGLAAAATLARKGYRICVVERAETVGGMARNRELVDGLRAPELAHLLYNLNPTVARDLGIDRKLTTRALPTVSLSPNRAHTVIRGGVVETVDGQPHAQAKAYAALHARLVTFAGILSRLSLRTPPALAGGLTDLETLKELAALGKLGLELKRLGKAEMQEFLRILLSNVHDLVLDDLDDGPLAGAMAADAVRGAHAGPRSPGTVFSLMYRMGNGGDVSLPLGGMGAVAEAFADAARAAGCDIRYGSGVARVVVRDDRACGVVLEDGAELSSRAVLSGAGPLQTMHMAGPQHFDVEAVRRFRNLRCRGTVAKVNLVLRGTAVFAGLPADLAAGRLLVAPSVDYVERAFNPAKYGEMPVAPSIEMVLPGLTDPALSAGGRQVLSAVVNFVPTELQGGWTVAGRDALLKVVLDTLEPYAPGLGAMVEHAETLTPTDIAARTGAPGGHWHHAEMGFDQVLTLRPVNGLSRYRFAVPGLYLCGASAHPGGDVTGVPGRNAALQLLKDGVLS